VTWSDELEAAIDRYHATAAEFIKGDPEAYMAQFSKSDEVCVANPFRPKACGWAEVSETIERAATLWREGEVIGFERVAEAATPELAYIMEIERYRAKLGGSENFSEVELRVTSVLRPEDGIWRVLHRHADPITTPRGAESVVHNSA
jgi:ketosteroid isomerase-like protein